MTDISRIPYAPSNHAGWSSDVGLADEAFDEIASGGAGVVLIDTAEPTKPATGQIWLDTDATGTGTAVLPVVTKTSGYTATTSDGIILCDASGGSFSVTLPAAASNTGRRYYVKKIDATANIVTVDGNGVETIDDSATVLLSSQYDAVTIACDGSEWWIL